MLAITNGRAPLESKRGPAPDPNIRLVTIFRTADPGLLAVVKSLFDEAGIDHFVRSESLRNVIGWGGAGVFAAFEEAEFQVREQDARRASALLARLNEPSLEP
jgi:hypothetical protein